MSVTSVAFAPTATIPSQATTWDKHFDTHVITIKKTSKGDITAAEKQLQQQINKIASKGNLDRGSVWVGANEDDKSVRVLVLTPKAGSEGATGITPPPEVEHQGITYTTKPAEKLAEHKATSGNKGVLANAVLITIAIILAYRIERCPGSQKRSADLLQHPNNRRPRDSSSHNELICKPFSRPHQQLQAPEGKSVQLRPSAER